MRYSTMKVIIPLLALCICLSSCSQDVTEEASGQPGFFVVEGDVNEASMRFDTLLKKMEDWASQGEVVGAELLVIENRNIILHEAYGWMDKELEKPMQKNTIFRIRSMTKPFISTAILMLAEEGKLELSDPVSNHLPSFLNDRSEAITIEQLLTHTGGFDQPGFPKDYEIYNHLREAADDIGIHGPQFAPGTKYIYSDAGVAVLGAVIEAISGFSAEEYIHDKLLVPLGMSSTYFAPPEDSAIRDRMSATYYRSGDRYVKYWDSTMPPTVNYFRGSGGMYATPLDYARFMSMWMSKGTIGSRQYLAQESVAKALQPGTLNSQYGYLWETGPWFGHGGSDGTIAFAIPEENIMVLYFTQSRSTHTTEVVKSMMLKEYGIIDATRYTKMETTAAFFEAYTGRYRNTLVDLEVTTDQESLLVKTADSSEQVFHPASEDFFFHDMLDIQMFFTRDAFGELSASPSTREEKPLRR